MASQMVSMQFDATTAQFVQKLLGAKDALQQTADKAVDAGQKIAKAGDQAAAGFEKMAKGTDGLVGKVAGIGAGFLTVQGVLGVFGRVYDEFLESKAQKTKNLIADTNKLAASMASSGQLGMTAEARMGLATIRSDLFSHRDAQALYGQHSAKMGGEATVAENVRATRAGIRAGEAGHDNLLGFMGTFGELAKNVRPGGKLEGLNDDELESLTAHVAKFKPGGLSEQDIRLMNRSTTAGGMFQSLNMILAASRSQESARGLEGLEQAAAGDVADATLIDKVRRNPGRASEEDHRRIRLAGIPEEQRMQAMLQDETLAPQALRRGIVSLRGDFNGNETQLAAQGNVLRGQIGDALRLEDEDMRYGLARRMTRAEKAAENLKERGAVRATIDKVTTAEVENIQAEATGHDPGSAMAKWLGMYETNSAKQMYEQNMILRELIEVTKKNGGGGEMLGRPGEDK